MQEAKHTQGPWHCGIWDGDPDVIEIYAAEKTAVGSDKINIAAINQNEATVIEEWQLANARLIAATPELLEAIQEVISWGKEDAQACYVNRLAYLKAVVAKAATKDGQHE